MCHSPRGKRRKGILLEVFGGSARGFARSPAGPNSPHRLHPNVLEILDLSPQLVDLSNQGYILLQKQICRWATVVGQLSRSLLLC